jgi:FdrA protein
MQLQRELARLPGVLNSGVVMATPANLSLLETGGLKYEGRPGPEDLLIVVDGADVEAAEHALAQVDALLRQRRGEQSQTFRPRSLESAARMLPRANWVLVSVPGRFAAGVAREAIRLGRNVFLYSDNVELDDEVEIKRAAASKGLFILGPDCGTAIINGVGLGFANRVRSGNIGMVGASGTGLQAIACRIDQLGGGISKVVGTGSRDLQAEVGGATTNKALGYLVNDPKTGVIVIVSKPSDEGVVKEVLMAARGAGKPVVLCLIGHLAPARSLGNLHFAVDLEDAAEIAVKLSSVGGHTGRPPDGTPVPGYLRGLFSGGTLAYEALQMVRPFLYPLYGNQKSVLAMPIDRNGVSRGHAILDLGADEFTQGRLHPMIDNDLRIRRLLQEGADPGVGVVLLDVVLGQGAHTDPAAELGPAIAEVRRAAASQGRRLEVVAAVVGTTADAQNSEEQIEKLRDAGAWVTSALSEACDRVIEMLTPSRTPVASPSGGVFDQGFAAINVGLESFYDDLIDQGVEAVQVDWRPRAGGNERLAALLSRMKPG